MTSADTIVALSSGRPPAAVSIIRTSGPHAFDAGRALAGRLPRARQAGLRRLVHPNDRSFLDEALVIVFPGPKSATGEDIVEYQCHGGRATIDAILSALIEQAGCRAAEPGEFTRRALANGRIDLTEAEGLADLLAAETEIQRRSAIVRAGGQLRRSLDDWRGRILALSARAEVAIDYADEDDGSGSDDLRPDLIALADGMRTLLSAPRVEPLRDGVRVVIAGPPNAGKSSLINALSASDRAIVTPIAGTTRDTIEVPMSISGVPFVLVDTAGLRDTDDPVEAIGIERANAALAGADLLLWLGEPDTQPPGSMLIAAKADVAVRTAGLPVSARTGAGIAELLESLVQRAMSLLPQPDEVALDRRQHSLLAQSVAAIDRAASLIDTVLVAEELRIARSFIDQITGRAGVEDLLDTLFGRFCLGK